MYKSMKKIELEDDTLREGIQSFSLYKLTLSQRFEILSQLNAIGVENAVVGFFNNIPQEELIVFGLYEKCILELNTTPWILCRLREAEILKLIRLAHQKKSKPSLNLSLFFSLQGNDDNTQKLLETIFNQSHPIDLRVAISIEDATRTPLSTILKFINATNLDYVEYIYLCDSVGCADMNETETLVKAVSLCLSEKYPHIKLGWHGHNDLGLALANSLVAISCGASVVSGTFLGIGERSGNAALEQVIVNLLKYDITQYNLKAALSLCQNLSKLFHYDIEKNRPLLGDRIFKTSLGLHQDKIMKNKLNKETYSGVNLELLEKSISFELSASSGFKALQKAFVDNELSVSGIDLSDFKKYLYDNSLIFSSKDLPFYFKEYINAKDIRR
jgi:2-isopropylmalate synthase